MYAYLVNRILSVDTISSRRHLGTTLLKSYYICIRDVVFLKSLNNRRYRYAKKRRESAIFHRFSVAVLTFIMTATKAAPHVYTIKLKT